MSNELSGICLNFLLFINQLNLYPEAHTCPSVEFVPLIELQQLACGGAKCPAEAFYNKEQTTIFMAQKLDLTDTFYQSIFLHELVHYVQDVTGNWEQHDNDCRAGMLRELYAFRVQERYLLDNNIHIPVSQNMAFYRC